MKLLFLHGAIGAADQMQPLAQVLETHYDVFTPDFYGHGGQASEQDTFEIPYFAAYILKYMDENDIDIASIVGYSMGGYVAMYMAKHYPGRIDKIITLATKYNWDEEIAAKEIKMLDAGKIAQKLPHFADALDKRHTAIGWQGVLARTANMMTTMGADNPLKKEDYTLIINKVLVAVGDRDKMVGIDETVAVYKHLPNAQLCILPATGHPIEQLDVNLAGAIFNNFLGK